MKLASYRHGGRTSYGAVIGESIVDLGRRLPQFPSLLAVLRAGALGAATAVAEGAEPDLALGVVTLLPPVTEPGKIICVGVNYADHAAESGVAVPDEPVVFNKAPSCICGPNDDTMIPTVSCATSPASSRTSPRRC